MTDELITRLARTCLQPIIASEHLTSDNPYFEEALENVAQALRDIYQRGVEDQSKQPMP